MSEQYITWLSPTLLWIHNGGTSIAQVDFSNNSIWLNGNILINGSKNNVLSALTASAATLNSLSGLIDANGDIVLTDTAWDDLRFSAAGINPVGAASDPTRDTTDGRLVFAGNADNVIALQIQMPHSWKEGTAIRPHNHWSPTTTDTAVVDWQLSYKIANVNEAFPADWSTLLLSATPSGTADMHEIDSFGEIAMTGKTLSCMGLIIIKRFGSTDASAQSVKLNEFDIHYEVDTFGSAEEFTK